VSEFFLVISETLPSLLSRVKTLSATCVLVANRVQRRRYL